MVVCNGISLYVLRLADTLFLRAMLGAVVVVLSATLLLHDPGPLPPPPMGKSGGGGGLIYNGRHLRPMVAAFGILAARGRCFGARLQTLLVWGSRPVVAYPISGA